jgi:hypothetical protein
MTMPRLIRTPRLLQVWAPQSGTLPIGVTAEHTGVTGGEIGADLNARWPAAVIAYSGGQPFTSYSETFVMA